jgi:hypothetical protein
VSLAVENSSERRNGKTFAGISYKQVATANPSGGKREWLRNKR